MKSSSGLNQTNFAHRWLRLSALPIALFVAIGVSACAVASDAPLQTPAEKQMPAISNVVMVSDCPNCLADSTRHGSRGGRVSQVSQAQTSPRLDDPVTPENSFLQDFGNGGILRIPKIVYPNAVFDHPEKPVQGEIASLTLQFPDMTLTDWKSHMDIIFEKQRGSYVPQKDRFPVYISALFYSPGNMGLMPTGQRTVWSLRPALALKNSTSGKKLTFTDSKYIGLSVPQVEETPAEKADREKRIEKQAEERKKNGWHESNRVTYVEKPGSPYELFMDCDDPSSLKCDAYVYSKSSQFQYRMNFPPEAVAHTDALIRAINKMIDQWVPKQVLNQH